MLKYDLEFLIGGGYLGKELNFILLHKNLVKLNDDELFFIETQN